MPESRKEDDNRRSCESVRLELVRNVNLLGNSASRRIAFRIRKTLCGFWVELIVPGFEVLVILSLWRPEEQRMICSEA